MLCAHTTLALIAFFGGINVFLPCERRAVAACAPAIAATLGKFLSV